MSVLSWLLSVPARRATIAMLLTLAVHLAVLSYPSSEAVRLRNSLLIDAAPITAFDWTPERMPADFKQDATVPSLTFVRAANALSLAQEPSEWQRALIIARHLREAMADLGPVFGDLETTYSEILRGRGYCGDATDVFLALAKPAGLSARQWGFSVTRYGGKGHAFVEVYDHQMRQWVYLDVFYNYYLVDPNTQRPLSALEVRAALLSDSFTPQIVPVTPKRAVDFNYGKRLEHFRQGADHWFLWWGNNVVALDEASAVGPLARMFPAVIARGAEQFRGVVAGAYPQMRAIESASNRADMEDMHHLRKKLLFIAGAGAALVVLLIAQIIAGVLRRNAARQQGLRPAQDDANAARELARSS